GVAPRRAGAVRKPAAQRVGGAGPTAHVRGWGTLGTHLAARRLASTSLEGRHARLPGVEGARARSARAEGCRRAVASAWVLRGSLPRARGELDRNCRDRKSV